MKRRSIFIGKDVSKTSLMYDRNLWSRARRNFWDGKSSKSMSSYFFDRLCIYTPLKLKYKNMISLGVFLQSLITILNSYNNDY